ncbi:MAG: GGDEF domain-containing protein [Actinobacteria bacterium]|nr:GGDEF domain-containing protein [Actinomycetota bacterium]
MARNPINGHGGGVTANGSAIVAFKASESLRRRQTQVVREWFKSVIDSLGLASLESFPTQEFASCLPGLIAQIAKSLTDPSADFSASFESGTLAAKMATLRREDPSVANIIDDYSALKRQIVAAVAAELRASDIAVLEMAQRLDEGFYQLLSAGIEAFIEQHSVALQYQANTDPLTGLYNVRYFRQQLHRNLELYKRYRIPFSLLMMDLDRLKQLNDACGHQEGDRALRHLAGVICEEKRETDIAVRYGGDEFFLVLPGTVTGDAERLATRIRHRVQALNLRTGGREMTGVSIGVVCCPADGADVGALRAKADRALYLAKAIGGGAVARYRDFSLQPQVVF